MTPTVVLDRLLNRLADAAEAAMELRAGAAPGKPLRALRSSLAIADALLRHIEAETEVDRASPARLPGDATGGDAA